MTSTIKTSRVYQGILFICLLLYLIQGIRIDQHLMKMKPISDYLLEDFGYYERALSDALNGKGPYSVWIIGLGYLYPPPALFFVEAFHYINSLFLKFFIYGVFNIALTIFIVTGIAKYYGIPTNKIWYWYVLCLGFAPLFELLYIGQINVITLFGIFMLFFWLDSSPTLSGLGLSLAIVTKVSPVVFFGYLIATKKIKTIVTTMVWTAILIFISALRYGVSPIIVYPEVFQWLSSQFPISNNSQSLMSKLVITFGFPFHNSEYQIFQKALMLYVFFIVLASGVFMVWGKQSKEPLFIITAFGMTILPNVMWYHHYVFLLLPVLVWMGWKHFDLRITTWCFMGLTIIQADRYLSYGLLIHVFVHITILLLLLQQIRQFNYQHYAQKTLPV